MTRAAAPPQMRAVDELHRERFRSGRGSLITSYSLAHQAETGTLDPLWMIAGAES